MVTNSSPYSVIHQIYHQICHQFHHQIWWFTKFVTKFGDKFVTKFVTKHGWVLHRRALQIDWWIDWSQPILCAIITRAEREPSRNYLPFCTLNCSKVLCFYEAEKQITLCTKVWLKCVRGWIFFAICKSTCAIWCEQYLVFTVATLCNSQIIPEIKYFGHITFILKDSCNGLKFPDDVWTPLCWWLWRGSSLKISKLHISRFYI